MQEILLSHAGAIFLACEKNISHMWKTERLLTIAGRSLLTRGDIENVLSNYFLDELPTFLKIVYSSYWYNIS
jgi:hypothetical protein